MAGITLSVAGFIVILIEAHGTLGSSAHQVMGILVITCICIQSLVGVVAHVKFDKTRKRVPLFPDRVRNRLN